MREYMTAPVVCVRTDLVVGVVRDGAAAHSRWVAGSRGRRVQREEAAIVTGIDARLPMPS